MMESKSMSIVHEIIKSCSLNKEDKKVILLSTRLDIIESFIGSKYPEFSSIIENNFADILVKKIKRIEVVASEKVGDWLRDGDISEHPHK